ncbi:conserved Plasmodium protein, unknown function [Plasmodium knowlesi strain H]|uniref:Uncharacterized protein n=3 Tax=Plasmodium knowlesi TaxID=5850 RepID=A0A5K1U673_PLAKH|nr:conserved Plasmodium protein, unknown function [Plasmodium knowlesi strain H]OTN64651.1 Uncharacterized protein PKNOH_S130188700 [Plasmodium knowlesi]CAA9989050.1 conserved Plasmodium protein, unknown function [Plasmodium knowlesi strain H]SBO27261.1 conserved Plasmodium protein, unknown function [Plasmodium knowlesi strain H]SBO28891.1 conserved Plasmodium protein, unknown function [Plasmodium knowlesi strain H]VVS78524.1 conserved Plasmodium protein, unknown function [Plasmodium knowlesi |eukprot:XP_002261399.1 hypothetical protein, conserved in Plasmodium species [Plasmodium knowlesi strain H]
MNDEEMSCVEEGVKNKKDNKVLYMHQILENQFDKQIKQEQNIYERNADLRKYEDYISQKKKRAFTLGAIDGIGGISFLNAPLMNPENAKIDPPILQLPSATNLIKNVHVKVHLDKNIDRSYKYRTQNSNKDIIRNMKPMYSLPEKVITYYMHEGGHWRAEQNEGRIREGVMEDHLENTKEEIKPDDAQMDKITDNCTNSNVDTEIEPPCEDIEMVYVANDTSDKAFHEEDYNIKSSYVSSPPVAEKEAMWSRGTTMFLEEAPLEAHLEAPSKAKLVKKNEDLKTLANTANTSSNDRNDTKINKNLENEDNLNFFKLNQIMSPTLTNALKMLADDAFI